MEKAIIIGGGLGGLATGALLAKAGYSVELFEKNERLGGRANLLERDGFTFDMGPSWYLMPEIFEQFFGLLDERIKDHLTLKRLSPSYRIYFKDTELEAIDIYGDLKKDLATIENLEAGAGEKLKLYLDRARYQYQIATGRFIYKNYSTIFDFLTYEVMTEGSKLSVFKSMHKYVSGYFKTEEVQKIMEYTLVFLGSSPYNTPALYNIMSHIDFHQGVFYPMGGIYELVKALARIGEKYGVKYHTNSPVKTVLTERGKAIGVELESGERHEANIVISNAGIYHTESALLPVESRTYSDAKLEKMTLAPSALLMYMGFDRKLDGLEHHTLVFAKDWQEGFRQIFDDPQWPTDPSFYVCTPSKTDASVAPEGKENVFILVPIASGLEYSESFLEEYSEKILLTLEKEIGESNLKKDLLFMEKFCVKDFISSYNAHKGTALGLAHTLFQTAIFRPDNRSKKLKGLYYVGGDTNPGIGMPMCLVSAQLLYKRLKGDKSSGPLESLE
jgi:phytoene desaturase